MTAIRPIAIGILRRGDEILVARGRDATSGEVFYRPLGGGLEFQEHSSDALRREFEEEIGASLTGLNLLSVLEESFVNDGLEKHELTFVYEARFEDPQLYDTDVFSWRDLRSEGWEWIGWRCIADFTNEEPRLYPEGLLEILRARVG